MTYKNITADQARAIKQTLDFSYESPYIEFFDNLIYQSALNGYSSFTIEKSETDKLDEDDKRGLIRALANLEHNRGFIVDCIITNGNTIKGDIIIGYAVNNEDFDLFEQLKEEYQQFLVDQGNEKVVVTHQEFTQFLFMIAVKELAKIYVRIERQKAKQKKDSSLIQLPPEKKIVLS